MMQCNILSAFLLTLLLGTTVEAAKILALFNIPVKSHFNAFAPYLEELAKRGHEMTVVSAFPRKTPLKNYTDIVLEETFTLRDSKEFNAFDMGDVPFIFIIISIFKMTLESCEKVLQQTNMQKLIHSKDMEFDLVLYEPFFTECTYGLLHKFKAPKIQLIPNTIIPWGADSVGNPSTTSYIPELVISSDSLDFMGRTYNLLTKEALQLFSILYAKPKMDTIMRKYFTDPSLPSLEELETDTAFLFLHSHPVLNRPRPLTPNTIEVGGLHIKDSNNLPQDLQQLLDNAPNGVIYFSLGSNVQSVDMPDNIRDAFIQTFSKLNQEVLWKWETETIPGKPKNVHISKWFPQNDILAHRNVKLFITHGGLMSTQEATYFGVPLIAIPVMADQQLNARQAQNSGYAIVLDFKNITEKSLTWALNEVLREPRYRENAKHLSSTFQDQPQKPLERAIFWTEYAIRHKGAYHLRSAALKLNFFQYHLLDVLSFLSFIGFVSLAIFIVLLRKISSCLCSKQRKSKTVSKVKKHN